MEIILNHPNLKIGECHILVGVKPISAQPELLTPRDIAEYIKDNQDPPLNLSGKLKNEKTFKAFVAGIKIKISNIEVVLEITKATEKIFLFSESDFDDLSLLIAEHFLDESFYVKSDK